MIASLTGVLKAKTPTEVLVDVNGVGYAVSIPLSTFERLNGVNSAVTLFTHLHVREDALQLYGFASEQERHVFKLLLSVNGVGPRIAQGILSGMSVSELRSHIAGSNIEALTSIPGVGRKTAERLVIELRDKIGKFEPSISATASPADSRTQALLALTSLGYQRTAAEKAIRQVLSETNGTELSLEELIKRSLRVVSAK